MSRDAALGGLEGATPTAGAGVGSEGETETGGAAVPGLGPGGGALPAWAGGALLYSAPHNPGSRAGFQLGVGDGGLGHLAPHRLGFGSQGSGPRHPPAPTYTVAPYVLEGGGGALRGTAGREGTLLETPGFTGRQLPKLQQGPSGLSS